MEYWGYKPGKTWYIRELLKIVTLCSLMAILLYNRIVVAPLLSPVGIYILRGDKKKYKELMQHRLRLEFKEFIIMLSGSLNAGYSLEQGVRRAYEDMTKEDFVMIPKELALMINGLGLNKDMDVLFMEMGHRCQEDSIIEFARLVATAKRYGGNINNLIDKTKKKLNDKLMVEKEIDTMISAKRLEGYIMMIMPFVIMAYMRFTNETYISLLYNEPVGIVVVTIALIMVLICGLIIRRITRIEV